MSDPGKHQGQQRFLSSPFMGKQLNKPAGFSPSGEAWQLNQLKKDMTIGSVEGVIKRDNADDFQSSSLREQREKETEVAGQEEFVNTEDIEDDELWESEEDYYEELEERNRLLEEALRERIENPFPPVYNQLMKLCDVITLGEKSDKPITFYLQEVESYINKKIKVFSGLPQVDNDSITRSNQFMLDGLNLLVEVCNYIRKFLDDNNPYNMTISRQLLVQANQFFSDGKTLLLSVKLD